MNRDHLVSFLLLALLWGSSFLFIEVALQGFSPLQIVVGRLVAGALVLATIVRFRGDSFPRGVRVWGHLAFLGVVANALPYFLFAWGQQHVTSGMAGVLNGTTPLFTLGIALAALPEEHFSRVRLTGLLIGFFGVFLVVSPWNQDPLNSSRLGQLACLGAALCYASSFVYTRRFLTGRGIGPLALSAGQLGCAALIGSLSLPFLAWQETAFTPLTMASVLVLGAGATGVAYPLFFRLIGSVGATTTSLVTYLIPIVAVALGASILREPVSWNLFVGAAVVILGVAVAEGRLGGSIPANGVRSRPTVDAPTHRRTSKQTE